MAHFLTVTLFAAILLPAIPMLLVPLFPTFWYLAAVAAIFLAVDGFTHITLANAAILLSLFLVSIVVDWSAGILGAKMSGARWTSVWFGALGAALGALFFPPLGILAGLFSGVLLGELRHSRPTSEAFQAAAGTLVGTVAGALVNLSLAVAFIGLFIAFALF